MPLIYQSLYLLTFWPSDVMTLLSRSSFHLLTASKVVLRVRSNTTKAAAASLKNICNDWRDWGWAVSPVIYSGHVPKPLLTSDVPQLQPHYRVLAVVDDLGMDRDQVGWDILISMHIPSKQSQRQWWPCNAPKRIGGHISWWCSFFHSQALRQPGPWRCTRFC